MADGSFPSPLFSPFLLLDILLPSLDVFPFLIQGYSEPAFGLGQDYLILCPGADSEYIAGTYAAMVYATQSTSFEIEIHVSSQVILFSDVKRGRKEEEE
jgi:hypothetical protein